MEIKVDLRHLYHSVRMQAYRHHIQGIEEEIIYLDHENK